MAPKARKHLVLQAPFPPPLLFSLITACLAEEMRLTFWCKPMDGTVEKKVLEEASKNLGTDT